MAIGKNGTGTKASSATTKGAGGEKSARTPPRGGAPESPLTARELPPPQGELRKAAAEAVDPKSIKITMVVRSARWALDTFDELIKELGGSASTQRATHLREHLVDFHQAMQDVRGDTVLALRTGAYRPTQIAGVCPPDTALATTEKSDAPKVNDS
jgi:hypothetical protein